jgi:spermidine/putrescine transport system substrate-binding protein
MWECLMQRWWMLCVCWLWILPLNAETLNLYIWSEYIDPALLKDFEKATGSKVNLSLYETSEDMLSKLQGGGVSQYDVVVPTDYLVPTMLKLNLLQPLNKALVPNLKNLTTRFQSPPYDPGNIYTAAYQWGTVGLGYRRDKVKNFVPSWRQIFDPKQQQGAFVLIDDQRPMLGAAAVYLGFDLNTTNREQLPKIQQLLIETKRRSAGFIGGVGGKNQLLAGTATVAVVYSGDAIRATQENPNIAFVIPKEGSNIWVDNMVIPAKAPHATLANKFINFILDAKNGARLSNFNRYASPNQASLPMINPQDRKNPGIYPTPTVMATLNFNTPLKGAELRLLDAVWTNIKSQ